MPSRGADAVPGAQAGQRGRLTPASGDERGATLDQLRIDTRRGPGRLRDPLNRDSARRLLLRERPADHRYANAARKRDPGVLGRAIRASRTRHRIGEGPFVISPASPNVREFAAYPTLTGQLLALPNNIKIGSTLSLNAIPNLLTIVVLPKTIRIRARPAAFAIRSQSSIAYVVCHVARSAEAIAVAATGAATPSWPDNLASESCCRAKVTVIPDGRASSAERACRARHRATCWS